MNRLHSLCNSFLFSANCAALGAEVRLPECVHLDTIGRTIVTNFNCWCSDFNFLVFFPLNSIHISMNGMFASRLFDDTKLSEDCSCGESGNKRLTTNCFVHFTLDEAHLVISPNEGAGLRI